MDDKPTEESGVRRDLLRRGVRVGGLLVLLAGLAILGYAGYQIWGTGIATSRAQDRLATAFEQRLAGDPVATTDTLPDQPGDFDDPDDVPVMEVPEPVEAPEPVAPVPTELVPEDAPAPGQPVGRIVAEEIDLDWMIVEGVWPGHLRDGPGHMPGTPLPGQPGNAVLSGHRTTNGAPFGDLDVLETGDLIQVETLIGWHTYEVVESKIVAPADLSVIEHRDGAYLTLTTCHPKFSARQRLIVVGSLISGPNYAVLQTAG
jgi:sortase A